MKTVVWSVGVDPNGSTLAGFLHHKKEIEKMIAFITFALC